MTAPIQPDQNGFLSQLGNFLRSVGGGAASLGGNIAYGLLPKMLVDPDREKRELMTKALILNPEVGQGLANQDLSDQAIQNLVGRAPAFGPYKDSGQNIANYIKAIPMSPEAQAEAQRRLQENYTPQQIAQNNPPELRALPQVQAQQLVANPTMQSMMQGMAPIPNLAALPQGNKTLQQQGINVLSPEKAELTAQRKAEIAAQATIAQTNEAKAREGELEVSKLLTLASIPRVKADAATAQQRLNNDKIVTDYLNGHPELKGRDLTDLVSDPRIPVEVRTGIANSNQYGGLFDKSYQKYLEKLRGDIERGNIKLSSERYLQVIAADTARQLGGQGTMKGWNDYILGSAGYQGYNPNSPEAQQVADIMRTGGPQRKLRLLSEFTGAYSKLTSDINNGKVSIDEVRDIRVPELNALRAEMVAAGIQNVPTKNIIYDVPKTATTSQKFQMARSHIIGQPPRVLQLEDGSQFDPSKLTYSPANDPNILQEKAQIYEIVKATNPNWDKLPMENRMKLVDTEYQRRHPQ